MITSKLSKVFDLSAQRRLVDAWNDPEVLISTCSSRFGITPEDIEKLKIELGPKARGSPLSPFWRQDRIRRQRRGWSP